MELSHISTQELKAYKSDILSFLEACSYDLNDDDIIIYINRLKNSYSPKSVRNKLIRIRKFLKFINHSLADDIKLPRIPKRRKHVIKPKDIRQILTEADSKLRERYALKVKSATLLSATSGIRAEELYNLMWKDIDAENRTIYVRAEFAKDYEDRVTFFSREAQEVLQEYLSVVKPDKPLFSKKSLLYHFGKLNTSLRMKHMRKFFSQQSDRLGMPTAVKKILMGHSTAGDVDLSHYDFQDEEELKKIYDKYWKDFRILDC
ncbi:tyrosine-type recombinase/integrase [Geoglobus acetivorans]|nr:tyrosine-type recombinase/integrase [Geoglobus acetivorans]